MSETSENAVQNKEVTEKLTQFSAEIGGNAVEYTSAILTEQGLIDTSGKFYASEDKYACSDYIAVSEGQKVSVTFSHSNIVASASFYNADKQFVRAISGETYVQTTIETTIEEGISFVRFCTHIGSKAIFSASLSGEGLIAEISSILEKVDKIEAQVTSAANEVDALSDKYEGIFERNVGEFYKNAWVRATDGFISDSTGGAKTFLILRKDIPDATEIYAKVCTENVVFAPIAFYSDENPSMSSFISALEGATDKLLHDYTATIPSNCGSILVMNMSQHQSEYSIKANQPMFELAGQTEIEDEQVQAAPIFNPFALKNQYYHFNQETAAAETFIPAQSLYDIRLAAQLGFEWIEANAWPCSDGVFITKHGSGGAFGNGIKSDNGVDYSAKQINSVSSEEVRSHITYDSRIAKYCSPIPTLEEFLAECKKYNMGVKTNNQSGLLAVMRKYLTDDKIFISYMPRGDFKGLLEVVYYPNEGYEKLEEKCNQTGYPLQVIIASGQFEGMSDDAVKAVVEWCHVRNYTVAVPYLSSMNWMRAQRLGVDVNLSCERTINPFLVGNDKNISSLSDSGIALSGSASYNAETDTIVMSRNSILTISADNIRFGAVSAEICYDGMVTIMFGHGKGIHSFVDIESDGNDVFSAAQAILPQNGEETTDFYIKIYAKEDNTIIKDLNVRCSKL